MRRRTIIAVAATLAVVLPLGWLWWQSLVPGSYSVMAMGHADYGGGPVGMSGMAGMAEHEMPGRSVASLTGPVDGVPDVDVTLTARKESFRLAGGRSVDGYTLNGTSPGPVIRAVAGQLVQVRLRNESVPGGVTLHWHGLDVPNAEDGVAGVTQDAVAVGAEYVYRFVARRAGTYWYHSHQLSDDQVQRGMLGALVIAPRAGGGDPVDALLLAHVYAGVSTINGAAGDVPFPAPAGARVRVRVINTDNGPMSVWVTGASFRVLAIDGADVSGPTPVRDESLLVTAGGRADLEVVVPESGGVRVETGVGALVLGAGAVAPSPRPVGALDMLGYGTPAPLGFDATRPDRRFDYLIGRQPGFLDGLPGLWWTINGHLPPDVPMFMVAEGDVVLMHVANHSGEVHPMHLHGHHVVVLARDGVRASGSPWWVDSLNVEDGQSYDVAFVADNPGIWMDHCHNLRHAAQGLVTHLAYEGVAEPFLIGRGNGPE